MKQKLVKGLQDFVNGKEEGACMVVYAMIAALIAVACVGAVTALGLDNSALFTAAEGTEVVVVVGALTAAGSGILKFWVLDGGSS